MKICLFLIVSLLMSPFTFAEPYFSVGNDLEAFSLRGRMTVVCRAPGESGIETVQCFSEILDPAEFSYFYAQGIQADQVRLNSYREDGTKESKTYDFDASVGKTKRPVNLWVDTLLQDPLLQLGENRIKYKFINSGQIIEQGQFIMQVSNGGLRQCQPRTEYAYSSTDCRTPSRLCGDYFREQNYCEK